MTESFRGISESKPSVRPAPLRHVDRVESGERITLNPEAIPGIDQAKFTEAIYWQAFGERLNVKIALILLEAKIYQKTKSGEPTEIEEAQWRRLKMWALTVESVFQAAEPSVLRPSGKPPFRLPHFKKSLALRVDR